MTAYYRWFCNGIYIWDPAPGCWTNIDTGHRIKKLINREGSKGVDSAKLLVNKVFPKNTVVFVSPKGNDKWNVYTRTFPRIVIGTVNTDDLSFMKNPFIDPPAPEGEVEAELKYIWRIL